MINISRRIFDANIKSLLHFDYPYYAEAGDGLGDEIGIFTWARQGSPKLAGSQIPADEIISGVPKFGYRCLHTDGNDGNHILGTASSAQTFSDKVEVTCWVRPAASSAGRVFALNKSDGNTLFSLTLDSLLVPQVFFGGKSYACTGKNIPLNTWTFLRVLLNIAGKSISVTVGSQTVWTQSLSSAAQIDVAAIRVGGFNGFTDEFCLASSSGSGIPAQPFQGSIVLRDIGGGGTGAQGNVTAKTSGAVCAVGRVVFNPAWLSANGRAFSVQDVRGGIYGDFNVGSEIMLLDNETGDYMFSRIEKILGSNMFILEAPYTNLRVGDDGVQCILVPNFNTLTVNAGVTLTCNSWDAAQHTGGVIAFRVKGDCTVRGSIITHEKGRARTDLEQMTHSKLIDKFIVGKGGGIFIACGGTFTATSSARIGASWPGNTGQGLPDTANYNGGNGGAGYGGAGASDDDSSHKPGGKGGVGGGGGGYDSTGYKSSSPSAAGDAGTSGTGGWGFYAGMNRRGEGGTQGKDRGGNSPDAWAQDVSTGGGGAGGASGSNLYSNRQVQGASPGANLILLAKTLSADTAAISTGGAGGRYGSGIDMGGAGTGFCYIAANRYT